MLLSYVVYGLSALTLFMLGWRLSVVPDPPLPADGNGWRARLPRWEYVAMVLVVALVMGLRFHTGYDHEMYRYEYRLMQRGGSFKRDDFEWMFSAVTWAFVKAGFHYTVYFAFWGGLQMALLCYGLRRHRFVLPWLGALMILGPYSINWFTFMRQWTVTCMLVAAVPLIRERKFWWYLLFVAFSILLHRASVLLLLLYFLPIHKMERWRWWVFPLALAGCALVGLYPVWMMPLRSVGHYLLVWGYEKYANTLMPVLEGEFRFLPWGVLHTLTFVVEMLALCAYRYILQHHADDKDLPYYLVFAFIGVGIENLFNNTVFFMTRPLDFVAVFVLILIAYLCYDLWQARRRWVLALVCVLSMSYVFINVAKSHYRPTEENEVILYHFVTDDEWFYLDQAQK